MARELASQRSSNAPLNAPLGVDKSGVDRSGVRKSRKSRRETRHIWFAVLSVVMLSAAAVWAFTLYSRSVASAAHASSTQAALEQSTALRSGIVVLRNQDGTVCQKRQIDNASGEIYGRERVPCDPTINAAEEKPQSQYSAGARLDSIRSAFQPKR
jgi:hypothetical protein